MSAVGAGLGRHHPTEQPAAPGGGVCGWGRQFRLTDGADCGAQPAKDERVTVRLTMPMTMDAPAERPGFAL